MNTNAAIVVPRHGTAVLLLRRTNVGRAAAASDLIKKFFYGKVRADLASLHGSHRGERLLLDPLVSANEQLKTEVSTLRQELNAAKHRCADVNVNSSVAHLSLQRFSTDIDCGSSTTITIVTVYCHGR